MTVVRIIGWGFWLYRGEDAAYYGRRFVAHVGPWLVFIGTGPTLQGGE